MDKRLKFLEEVDLDSFDIFHEEISDDQSIWSLYQNTGAVWGIVSKNGIIDVHSTSNIKNEMLSYKKYIEYSRKILYENGNIDDIKDKRIRSKVIKLCNILKENDKITFVIYFYSQDLNERLFIEACIAIQNNCKFWRLHDDQLENIKNEYNKLYRPRDEERKDYVCK